MSRFSRPLNPAVLIVLVVQLLLLSGTAYAAIVVTGANVKDGSLTGKDIKNDSLTGADVREGTLKKVRRAAAADALAGDVLVKRIRYFRAGTQPQNTILRIRSLTLKAACFSGDVTVTATTTNSDSEIAWFEHDASLSDPAANEIGGYLDGFKSGDAFELPSTSNSETIGSLRYVASNGDVIVVELTEEDDLGGLNCVLSGYAIG